MRINVTKQLYTGWELLTPPASALKTATTIATAATTVTTSTKTFFIEKSAFVKVYYSAESQLKQGKYINSLIEL